MNAEEEESPKVYQNSIKEGWITKQGRSFVPTWKRRYFVVVEGLIEYYADSAKTVQKGVYNLDADTEVEDMTASVPNQFLISSKTSGKMYCKVDPGGDVHDWMAKIQSATPFAVLKSQSQDYDGEYDYSDPMFTKSMDNTTQVTGRTTLWDKLRGRGNAAKQQSTSQITTFASNTTDMEGWVSKLGGFRKNWKKRYLILDGNKLKYFTDEAMKTQKNMFMITSSSTVVENPQGYEGPSGEYLFSVKLAERELVLAVPDRDIKDQWVRLLMIAQNGGVLPAHLAPPEEEVMDDFFSKPKKNSKNDTVANYDKQLEETSTIDSDMGSAVASVAHMPSIPSPSPRNSFSEGYTPAAPVISNADFTPDPPSPRSSFGSSTRAAPVESDPFASFSPKAPSPPSDSFPPQDSINEGSDPFQSSTRANKQSDIASWGSEPSERLSHANAGESDPFKAMERVSSSTDSRPSDVAIREPSASHVPRPPSPPLSTFGIPASALIEGNEEEAGSSRGSSVCERESFQEDTNEAGAPPRMMIPTPAEIERAMAAKREQEEKEKLRREGEERMRKEEEERIEREKHEEMDRIANLLNVSMQSKSKDVLAAGIKEAESGGFSNPSCKYYELFLSALDMSHEMDEEARTKELEEKAAELGRERTDEAARETMRQSTRSQQRHSLDIAPIQLSLPSVDHLQKGQPDSDDEDDDDALPQAVPNPPPLPPPPAWNDELASALKDRLSVEEKHPIPPPEAPVEVDRAAVMNQMEDAIDATSSTPVNDSEEVGGSGVDENQEDDEQESEEAIDEDTELSMEGWLRVKGQRRYVVLSESTLILYKEVDQVKKKKGVYTLTASSSVALDANAGPLCFEIKDGKSASNNLPLTVKKGADMTAWMKALNKAISRLNGGVGGSGGIRDSALGLSMSSSRGSVMVDKKSLIAKIASPQAAMEKFKPQVRGFTREIGTFTPMGAEYVQFGWLEVKLNTALKWNRMFCTIEQSEEQRILRCYSNDDMKEVLSSSFLVSGQYTEESPLLGELAFVLKAADKTLIITLRAHDRSSRNEWCRTIDGIVTDWD